MTEYKHSVSLDVEKCKGCTNCLKRCPTEAIRIRNGHAVINATRCIDCGECIRVCPYKAKKAITDRLEDLSSFKYKIALPAPTLYGQFDGLDDIDYVIQGLYNMGFDHVYEVSKAAELVTEYTRRYINDPSTIKPVISSACPVIARLISLRFPFLCENVLPILSPMELAGKLAKEEALKTHPELRPEDIVTCFISPCPAKASFVKNDSSQKGYVDFVISMNDIYFALLSVMRKDEPNTVFSSTGIIGIGWATSGGEASALLNDRYLAADGIENVIKVLDEIDNGTLPNLEFVELNACNGGCVGGVLTVANPYIAKARLRSLKRYLPVSRNRIPQNENSKNSIPPDYLNNNSLVYNPVSMLAENTDSAIKKMTDIQKVLDSLPGIDCGSCGAPTCQAFAYDVIKGESKESECIVKMRERISELMEMSNNE